MIDARLTAALAGRYRIERELGAGGMATVYLAEDVRHRRRVALKVLHPELSAVLGTERFLKEIELTASLQHPHILPLFDSGEADGQLYYVMPLVDGETLRGRLECETQLPLGDALQIAREVADALQYAHGRGVIHRDIKPENILLQGGHALVADFGIALAVQQAGGQRMTQTGLSLGTPQYMAPEQAMGEKTVDARADIYALGAVTYEMLAGEPPFTGPTAQAIVARLLTTPPAPLTATRSTVPSHVDQAVLTALAKLPADRFSSANEFVRALNTVSAQTPPPLTTAPRVASTRDPRTWVAIGAVAVAVAALGALATLRSGKTASATPDEPTMATLSVPQGEQWLRGGNGMALSPDGRTLAVVMLPGADGPSSRLALRRMGNRGVETLRGTDGAQFPFWSPDGASIGFFAGGALKRLDLDAGAIRTLCPANEPRGGAWARDGDIIFSVAASPVPLRVRADGGDCKPLALRAGSPRSAGSPYFLDDGRHFVLADSRRTWIGSLDDDTLTLLSEAYSPRSVVVPPDYLMVVGEDGSVRAQHIDARARRLEGRPVQVLDSIASPGSYTALTGSANGTLVASGVDDHPRKLLAVVSRASNSIDSTSLGFDVWRLTRSRDGRRMALAGSGLWIFDLARHGATRMPVERDARPDAIVRPPVWSPGDTALAFTRDVGDSGIVLLTLRGERASRWLPNPQPGRVTEVNDWSADGTRLLVALRAGGGSTNAELWTIDTRDGKARALVTDGRNANDARFSPDGKWVTYSGTENGERQIYLRPSLGDGAAIRVSPNGGSQARWRGDSREFVYLGGDGRVQAVAVGKDGALGEPIVALDNAAIRTASEVPRLEVSLDGQEFIFILATGQSPDLTLILNWPALLARTARR